MAWNVVQGSPADFTLTDPSLVENIDYARTLVNKAKDHAPRLVCRTKHGWGSCTNPAHMPVGTYYIEVRYMVPIEQITLADIKCVQQVTIVAEGSH